MRTVRASRTIPVTTTLILWRIVWPSAHRLIHCVRELRSTLEWCVSYKYLKCVQRVSLLTENYSGGRLRQLLPEERPICCIEGQPSLVQPSLYGLSLSSSQKINALRCERDLPERRLILDRQERLEIQRLLFRN